MNKKQLISINPSFSFVCLEQDFFEFKHKTNGLRVLFHHISGTNVVTSNIVYNVGSKQEVPGESGLAHMLEHMIFKPTKNDLLRKMSQSSIMELERDFGAVINASTWKDRTNYYCTAPAPLLEKILSIQADQMENVVITDKNLKAERSNVLSEYDMYNSDPYFALEANMSAVAYLTHPYRHETIGWRNDIEQYTAEKLNTFYKKFYVPNNATLILVGDVELKSALEMVDKTFGKIPKGELPKPSKVNEPAQEGVRRVSVIRPTKNSLLSLSVKSPGLTDFDWIVTLVLLKILADGPDSLLHRFLVDTGRVTNVDYALYPTTEPFLSSITCTLANNFSHKKIEGLIIKFVADLKAKDLKVPLQKTIAQISYVEPFTRDSSNCIASELTEYVGTADWTLWCKTEQLINKISVKDLLLVRDRFIKYQDLTIGYFIGDHS